MRCNCRLFNSLVSRREPNRRRAQQLFDDIRCKLAPFDADTLFELPRDMRLDNGGARRWRRQLDADLDEAVKTQIALGVYECTAQAEVLDAGVNPDQCGYRHVDRYVH